MWSEYVQMAINPFLDMKTVTHLGRVCRHMRSAYSSWMYTRQIECTTPRLLTPSSARAMVSQMRSMGLLPLFCVLSRREDITIFKHALDRYRGSLLYPIHSEQDIRNFYSPHAMRVMLSSNKHPSWRWSRHYLRRIRACLHNRQLYCSDQLCAHNLEYACIKYHERRCNLKNGIIHALMDKLVPQYWHQDTLSELLDHLGPPQPPAHWFGLLCAASDNLRRQVLRTSWRQWCGV